MAANNRPFPRGPASLLLQAIVSDPRYGAWPDAYETRRLVIAARNGDEDARATLVFSVAKFAWKMARKYTHPRALEFDDAFQAAMLGAAMAVDRFDLTRDVKFITAAFWWMKHALTRARDNTSHLIRIPADRQRQNAELYRFVEKHLAENGTTPDAKTIGRALGVSIDVAEKLEREAILYRVQSMHGADGVRAWLLEPVAPPDDAPTLKNLERAETILRVRKALGRIRERDRLVLLQRSEGRTLKEIAAGLGVTRERVRQLEKRGLRDFAFEMNAFGPAMTMADSLRDTA